MDVLSQSIGRLERLIDEQPGLAIAVSGGVDSMTLASLAHRRARGQAAALPLMVHAVSPAVPTAARALIEDQAGREGWALTIIDAGEQNDPRYRANPFNRCYFCKTNLYAAIRGATDRIIASGTNLDDLSDHRPGLIAAREHAVIHPFVMAGIDKATIRGMARHFGWADFAELPAQPCLASRIETGIAIDARDLAFIDRVERAVRARLGAGETVRVRLRHSGAHLEIGGRLDPDQTASLTRVMQEACTAEGRHFAAIEPYRLGAAFLREPAA